jgi:pimeloyl-ACP methyl ester carboxylesterase
VEVFGDLDRARDIAVLVPGAGWDLSKLLSDTTSADSPVIAARALRAEMHRLEPASSTAVVVWLGYDAPEGIDREAMRSGRAIAGGRPLARFLAGLRYGDQDSRHVSLIGHSYGAVVAGRAVAARARVADFVALAAPGIDVSSAAGLHAAGGTRVWAARDARDPIRFTPFVRFAGLGHGTDPTEPTFGASVFRTGSARGHAGYFARGSESLTNLARIALGRTREVTLR